MKNITLKIDEDLKKYISETEIRPSKKELMLGFSEDDDPGIRYRFVFPNGWQASVIKFWGSYGWDNDEWEVAVLDKNNMLHYDNPICEGIDVVGWREDYEVDDILRTIMSWDPDAEWPEYEEERSKFWEEEEDV